MRAYVFCSNAEFEVLTTVSVPAMVIEHARPLLSSMLGGSALAPPGACSVAVLVVIRGGTTHT